MISQFPKKTDSSDRKKATYIVQVMSGSRTVTNYTNDELKGLSSKLLALAALLPHSSSSCTTRVPALEILKETCSYINSLQCQVNDLSDKLSQLLASLDTNNADLELLKDFLQQRFT